MPGKIVTNGIKNISAIPDEEPLIPNNNDKAILLPNQCMVKVELLNIDNIATKEETIDVVVKITFQFYGQSFTTPSDPNGYFDPNFTLADVKQIHNIVTSKPQIDFVDENEELGITDDLRHVTREYKITATIKNEFDICRFPFDQQQLFIEIRSDKFDKNGDKFDVVPWVSDDDKNCFYAHIDEKNAGWDLHVTEPLIRYNQGELNDNITISVIAKRMWGQPALALIVPQTFTGIAIMLALRVRDVAESINLHFAAVLAVVVWTLLLFQILPAGSFSLAQYYNLFILMFIIIMMVTSSVMYEEVDHEMTELLLLAIFGSLYVAGNLAFIGIICCQKTPTHESFSRTKKKQYAAMHSKSNDVFSGGLAKEFHGN